MTFSSVIGHDTAKNLLAHSIATNHIGHAYIIEGKRGVGRMSLALAFASALLKTDSPNNHPDFCVVTNNLYDPTKTQKALSIESARQLKKDIYIKPYSSDKKVYIVPFADTMQAAAQNALLKVFEEPPEYCVIILLAENSNSFLPTILSRATVLHLHPLHTEQVEEYLKGEKGIAPDMAEKLAIISGGSIGQALELSEDNTLSNLRDETISHLMDFLSDDYRALYRFVKFLKKNKGEIDFITEVLLSWSSDIIHIKLMGTEALNTDKKDLLKAFSGKIPRDLALKLSEVTIKYKKMIDQNVNYSAAVLCMALEYWEEIHGRNYRS